jgi:2'-5' RNA ligase
MRLFTAIDIPQKVRATLADLLQQLRPLARLSWSQAEKLHVTTKFIGEWQEARVEEVCAALATITAPGPIEIAIRGLGWFPNANRPFVFWAGIEASELLHDLAQATERTLARIGVPVEDREFHPHLTLARVKDKVRLDPLQKALAGLPTQDFGSFRATSFGLYLSAGGKYTRLREFSLTHS